MAIFERALSLLLLWLALSTQTRAESAGDVIDVIDIPTLAIVDHIPTGHDPEVFEVSQDQQMLYVFNKERSAISGN